MDRPFLRLGGVTLGDYAAFTDESSISGHRYMLVGGISCSSTRAKQIHNFVESLRAQSPWPTDSLQWKHYRPAKHEEYKRLIDYFVRENDAQRIDFSCVVIDTRKLDHRRYNEGDGETFFQKVMYQFYLTNLIRKYGHPPILRGFHGRRESRYEMNEVRGIINAGAARDVGKTLYRPLRQFEYMDVEKSGPHQLADTLLGAVSYYWNTGLQRGGESRKRALAQYVQSECCAASLGKPTPHWLKQFDIWEMRLKDRGSRA